MSNRRNTAKAAQQYAEVSLAKMEKSEVPTMKETAEKATQVVKAGNSGMHNIKPNRTFF
jgi:fatty acid elongase 3